MIRHRHPRLGLSVTILVFSCVAESIHAWQPGTGNPGAAEGFTVDVANRRDVLAFHNCVYQASEGYASRLGWTGSVAGGNAGTTSAVFKEDVRRRINYYRALAGLPADIVFNAAKSDKCQQAALMMTANNALNHYPPSWWLYYTAAGYEAAGKSNLALGYYGPGAVDGYMVDPGAGNEIVGHRRWLLYQRAREMGTGDIPESSGYWASNCLWVIGDSKPAPPAKFVAWPNEGYVPAPLVPARWSLSYPGANFVSATVSMSRNGTNVPLSLLPYENYNVGDNTIVWEPSGLPSTVTEDTPYVVTVSGIAGTGVPATATYTVRIFNPDLLGEEVAISGSDTPSTSGEAYVFNSIGQADSYQLEVATIANQTWSEGAEDSPAPRVIEAISAGYPLRQNGLFRTGAKAFQLTYPAGVWDDQSFTIDRDIIPGATSQLQYYDRARYTTTTTTLETQISTDDGSTWTNLTGRNGVCVTGYSSEWDPAWISRSISLSAYAGKVVRLRFIMKANGGYVYEGTTANYGFFIDDITVTNAKQVAAKSTTTLAGGATWFTLDSTTAGAALVAGTGYNLRIRPNVGCRWFPYGALKTVTAAPPPPPSYGTWASGLEITHGLAPGTLADPGGDPDHDGRVNLMEYAFGGSPLAAGDSAPRMPVAQTTATHLVLRYQIDTALADLSITAQAAVSLVDWKAPGEGGAPAGFADVPVSTSGGIQTREASIPLASGGHGFLRVRVLRQ
jgi:uncharacterized protein YkwD